MSFVFDLFTQAEPDGSLATTFAGIVESIPHAPSRISEMGLFGTPVSLLTTTATFDVTSWGIDLISDTNRNSGLSYVAADPRSMVDFRAGHITKSAKITEEDIRNIRQLGTAGQLEGAKTALANKLKKPIADNRATREWKRLGAIRGKVLDANGTTVLVNLFDKFGLTERAPMYFDVNGDRNDGDFNDFCAEILDLIADSLGGLSFERGHVFVDSQTMRVIKNLPEVRESLRIHQDGAQTRSGSGYGTVLEYGDLTFEVYRGRVGDKPFVKPGEMVAFPVGASNFYEAYAPADQIGEEYQIGQPEFYIPFEDPRGKFEEVEVQSNPLILNLRPLSTVIAYVGTATDVNADEVLDADDTNMNGVPDDDE